MDDPGARSVTVERVVDEIFESAPVKRYELLGEACVKHREIVEDIRDFYAIRVAMSIHKSSVDGIPQNAWIDLHCKDDEGLARAVAIVFEKLFSDPSGPSELWKERSQVAGISRSFLDQRVLERSFRGHRGILFADRFQMLRAVARGGQGVIWKAIDMGPLTASGLPDPTWKKRLVAIKFVRTSDDDGRRFFDDECDLLATLRMNGIPTYVTHSSGDDSYLVMEWVSGLALNRYLDTVEVKKYEHELVRIIRDAAAIVGALHDSKMAHCDLKPENILVTYLGEVKVIDFGFARMLGTARRPKRNTETGKSHPRHRGVFGTPGYMSPEQQRGKVDCQTDVHALGQILQRQKQEHDAAWSSRHPMAYPFMRADRSLNAIIAKALALDASRRYPHARAMHVDLCLWLAERGVGVESPMLNRARAIHSQRIWRRSIVSAVVGVLTLLCGVLFWKTEVAQRHANQRDAVALALADIVTYRDPWTSPGSNAGPRARRMLESLLRAVNDPEVLSPELYSRVLFEAAGTALSADELAQAEQLFKRVIDTENSLSVAAESSPRLIAAKRGLGRTLLLLGREEEGRAQFGEAFDMSKASADRYPFEYARSLVESAMIDQSDKAHLSSLIPEMLALYKNIPSDDEAETDWKGFRSWVSYFQATSRVQTDCSTLAAFNEAEAQFPGTDSDWFFVLNSRAKLLEKLGHDAAAERDAIMAAKGTERNHGLDHPNTINMLLDLSRIQRVQGKFAEAEATALRALTGAESIESGGSEYRFNAKSVLATTKVRHGIALIREGDRTAAMSEFTAVVEEGSELLATLPDALRGTHIERQILAAIGMSEFSLRRFSEAEAVFRRAISPIPQSTLHPTEGWLARAIAAQGEGRSPEVIKLMEPKLSATLQESPWRRDLPELIQAFADALAATGQTETAAVWRERIPSLPKSADCGGVP